MHSTQKLKEKIRQAQEKINGEKERINLTDNDVKIIKNKGTIDLNYNCQAAITEDGIIVSTYTSNSPSYIIEIIRSVINTEQNIIEQYSEVPVGSGFAPFDNFEEPTARGKVIYIPDQQMESEEEKAQNPYHRSHFIYSAEKKASYKELPFYTNSKHKRIKQECKVYRM